MHHLRIPRPRNFTAGTDPLAVLGTGSPRSMLVSTGGHRATLLPGRRKPGHHLEPAPVPLLRVRPRPSHLLKVPRPDTVTTATRFGCQFGGTNTNQSKPLEDRWNSSTLQSKPWQWKRRTLQRPHFTPPVCVLVRNPKPQLPRHTNSNSYSVENVLKN